MISLLPVLFGSPVFRYAAVGFLVVAFIVWQRHDAAREAALVARAQCVADADEAARKERERLKRANLATLREADERAKRAETEIAELREKTDAVISDLRDKGDSCPVPDDIVRRLLDIR